MLIDKGKLLRCLQDHWLATSPNDNDSEEVKNERAAMCRGIDDVIGIVYRFPETGGWISVKDRLPESGKHVLVTCEIRSMYGYKKQYVCEAFHAEKHSLPEGKYPEDTDCYDYSEEDDEYYLKEGWYEVIHNWDDYGSVVIGDFVTHWMPLPEPPKEGDQNADR